MINILFCPDCKRELFYDEKNLVCKSCKINYVFKNGITYFPENISHQNKNKKIKKLVQQITDNGYDNAIENFVKNNPEFKSRLTYTKYDRSADIIFHGIGNTNLRCLEIKSSLGNKVEILSNIFKQVYSIEFEDELLEIQKCRFIERKCDNISIIKCDIFKLPFPDDYFDLVLCNDILEKIFEFSKEDPYSSQKNLIKELKRIINNSGKIVFGVDNEKNLPIKNKRNLTTKTFSKYQTLFKESNLHVKSYWVLPSFEKPYFSGLLSDKLPLKWFLSNIDRLVGEKTLSKKIKILFSIFKKSNYPFIRKLLELYSPSFIFYCQKNILNNSIEDWIKRDLGYENFLMLSRRMKILFVLFNKKGIPEKMLSIKRYGQKFPTKLKSFKREFPNMKDPELKCWMEDWIPGRSLNSLNIDEVNLAIDWLINFQKNSKQEVMNEDYVTKEIELIKKGLEFVPHGDLKKYFSWLNNYKDFVLKNKIHYTAVHGDFWVTNILYEQKTKKISVLDWELFREKGNPLFDFLLFIYDLMAKTSDKPLETFEKNLEGKGEATKVINHVKSRIEKHFGFKMNFELLLRYYLIKKMIPKEEEMISAIPNDNDQGTQSTLYMEMLDVLSQK